jgi:aspartyl/asparaginyl beta-hydroxylase (cupin superfamily)
MQALNRFVSRTMIRAGSTQNTETEPIGAANRIYAMLGQGSDFLGRLKRRNRTAFRAGKYALVAALAYWIFLY